jgi:FKBP-type peptidyl-prolyl cis-trans isomerase
LKSQARKGRIPGLYSLVLFLLEEFMKQVSMWVAGTAALGLTAGVAAQEVSGELDELSYKMGYDLGGHVLQLGVKEVNVEVFTRAMSDAMAGRESILSAEQNASADQTRQALQTEEMERRRVELASASQANADAGKAFLAENAKREGVLATDSGLLYEVVEMGEGMKPAATDTVEVHYRGTLIDGTEFDSSYKRGQPAVFALNRVISGWTEGLQLMPAGSKFKFYIPSDLAYGGRTTGSIGPNSTLVFDIELLSIKEQ